MKEIPDRDWRDNIQSFSTKEASFSVALVPCSTGVNNWSLDKLSIYDSVYNRALGAVLSELNVEDAFVPATAKFNATVLQPGAFKAQVDAGVSKVWRNSGSPADGMLLYAKSQTMLLSPGGCPTVVAVRGDDMVAVHTGEKCLFDYRLVTEGLESRNRPYASVVESVLVKLGVHSAKAAKEVHVWIFYSIDAHRYCHSLFHPIHQRYNNNLLSLLRRPPYVADKCVQKVDNMIHLDLPGIISRQFTARAVPWTQINMGFSVLPTDDKKYPTTRAVHEKDRGRRYLVAVRRD